jgi:hypothetical protein
LSDSYIFWGICLSEGEVTPANVDKNIFYTEDVIRNNLDGLVGTDIRFVHTKSESVDPTIGEVIDYNTLNDNVFVLNQIFREDWENFTEKLESQENVKIGASFKQLIEEIQAGNLALSAGLRNAVTTTTPEHENTVLQYDWREVSIVPNPASPGAWAWGCDDQCKVVFQETMSEQEVNIEPEEDPDNPEEEGEVIQNEPQVPNEVQMGDETFRLVPMDEVEQENCSCNTKQLEDKIEQLKDERDQYKQTLEQFEQKRRKQLTSRIEQLNQELPEDKAFSEDEIEQRTGEGKSVANLEDQVNLMERLVPVSTGETTLEQEEEDLSGASSPQNRDETEERVDEISQNLFGQPLESVMDNMEEQYGGK